MELLEAIRARRSIRGYKPDHVPKEVLSQLIEIALRSPSAVNTQPWEFVIIMGKVLDAIKQSNVDMFDKGIGDQGDLSWVNPVGPYRERQVALAVDFYQLMGIAREDREKRDEWTRKLLRFFDAPAVILVCIDESALSNYSVFDTGVVTQTIALTALELGLGTCIARGVVHHPDMLRRIAGIPDSKKIIIGIAIGYPDWEFPANKMRTAREALASMTTWRGWD